MLPSLDLNGKIVKVSKGRFNGLIGLVLNTTYANEFSMIFLDILALNGEEICLKFDFEEINDDLFKRRFNLNKTIRKNLTNYFKNICLLQIEQNPDNVKNLLNENIIIKQNLSNYYFNNNSYKHFLESEFTKRNIFKEYNYKIKVSNALFTHFICSVDFIFQLNRFSCEFQNIALSKNEHFIINEKEDFIDKDNKIKTITFSFNKYTTNKETLINNTNEIINIFQKIITG